METDIGSNNKKNTLPHRKEPYKHSNHGIRGGPQNYSNLKFLQLKEPLLSAWPTQWSHFPLK